MNDETLTKRVDQLERVNRELLVQISAMRLLFGSVGNVLNASQENAFTVAVNQALEANRADAANQADLDDASRKFREDVFKCAESLLPGSR
ncbi:hypothetical protein KWG64_03905 [Rahnella sp. PD12R]|uniref:hypothetical protein n=1 Tax=Rahnella sp. PD12R TaxID=2855688 RepID=UPI001C4500E6|nr:hypothetical protein [Rahnella sp. PD12R]MBV6817083.1 hypothetical protein [Rahnella sp. PD12R]